METELNPQDDLSGEAGDNTSGDENPRTYTEEEHLKGISDTLAKRGRELASEHKTRADKAERDNKGLQSQIDQSRATSESLQKQLDELEAAKFGDNPDVLALHKGTRTLQAGRAKLEQEKLDADRRTADLEEREAKVKSLEARETAAGVLSKFDGVTAQELVDHTDGTLEEMEKFAKRFGKPKKGKAAKTGEGDEDEDAESKDLSPDPGTTIGGLTGDKLLEKANEDFNKGKISGKRYQEIVARARK